MDAHHLVALPEMYTDLHTGVLTQPAELTAEQWEIWSTDCLNWAGSP